MTHYSIPDFIKKVEKIKKMTSVPDADIINIKI